MQQLPKSNQLKNEFRYSTNKINSDSASLFTPGASGPGDP